MIARLAAIAAAAALPLIGAAHQTVAPVHIYVAEPAPPPAKRDYAVTVDETLVPVTATSPGPQRLSAIVLLDRSDSLRLGPVVDIRKLAGFARPGDTVRMGTFADRVAIGSTAIVDGASAAQAEREVTQAGGASPLWDAICASVDALRSAGGLRVVVVFSDAQATANDRGFDETYDIAVRAGVIVSVIGLGDDALRFPSQMQVLGRNDNLRRLARDTGGEYSELRTRSDEPTTVLVGQLDRLRARIRLEFLPPVRDGGVHRVSVGLGGRPIGGPVRIPF